MGNINSDEELSKYVSLKVYKFISIYELHERLDKIKRLESFTKVSEFIIKRPLCTNIYKTFLSYNVGNYYHPYCPNFDYFEYLFSTLSKEKLDKVKIGLSEIDYNYLFN